MKYFYVYLHIYDYSYPGTINIELHFLNIFQKISVYPSV